MLPDYYKDIDNVNTFMTKIEKWTPKNCPFRLCKVYTNNTSFVSEQKRDLEYSIELGGVFLLLASIILLQVHASVLTF